MRSKLLASYGCIFVICVTGSACFANNADSNDSPSKLTPGNLLLEGESGWSEVDAAGQVVQKILHPISSVTSKSLKFIAHSTVDRHGKIYALLQVDPQTQQLQVAVYDSQTGEWEFPEALKVPTWEVAKQPQKKRPGFQDSQSKELEFPGVSNVLILGDSLIVANNQANSWQYDLVSGKKFALPIAFRATASNSPETFILSAEPLTLQLQTLLIHREINLANGALQKKYLLERGGSEIVDPEGHFFGAGRSRVDPHSTHFRQSADGTELAAIDLRKHVLKETLPVATARNDRTPKFGHVDVFDNRYVISCSNRDQLFMVNFELETESVQVVKLDGRYFSVQTIPDS